MPSPAHEASAAAVHWIDRSTRLPGIPGEFSRHGRYLYVKAGRSDGVVADGHLVDGLQLVRTSAASPTRLEVDGLVLEGVEGSGSVGVRVVEYSRDASEPRVVGTGEPDR
jgi:hypothetical protein